jgi:micrococcal nuclease
MSVLIAAALLGCTVTDGDTLRCGDERVRLLGIDAPEMHGCAPWRQCVPGDGAAARAALEALVRGRTLTIERVGVDRYGRTLGVVWADGANLSCAMVTAGQAAYIARWDNGGRVARECPAGD